MKQPVPATPQPQPTATPTRPNARQQRVTVRWQALVASPEFAQISGEMVTRWPHLFRVTADTIRPLAIGIAEDLCAALPECDPDIVRLTLKQWVADHRVQYWATLVQGGPRYRLDGTTCGEVSPKHQAAARKQWKAWREGRAARLALQKPASVPETS